MRNILLAVCFLLGCDKPRGSIQDVETAYPTLKCSYAVAEGVVLCTDLDKHPHICFTREGYTAYPFCLRGDRPELPKAEKCPSAVSSILNTPSHALEVSPSTLNVDTYYSFPSK